MSNQGIKNMEGGHPAGSTMSSADAEFHPAFEAEELGRYSSLSILALLAIVFSLLSALTLLVPPLIVLPVVGIVLAIFAWVRIGASEGSLSGQGLAKTALFLSVVFLCAGPLRFSVRDAMYERQAAATTQQWFDLLAKQEFASAVDMMSASAVRGMMPKSPPGTPQEAPEVSDIIALLKATPLYPKLESVLGKPELQRDDVGLGYRGAFPIAAVVYKVAGNDSFSFRVNLVRVDSQGFTPHWQIDGWQLDQ